ncbi:bifunctional 4-hydroxy-2-oxoglutarate aldolase/2-dehydro-3-deoxy-phosphogluconate aldolase [Algibacillus agarilyticus]|uniref:bifunctional 4-hydroxy-2-oxoglutarate aldolase/2-dehydro-3-deoxy-phosphogluconate aldolase n=1 Tax=Algibacillus agarilyticus TaxID=2234133 RepID=UPI000DCFE15C|nr:bifunctional 4-hydroxy-2-oxoglutarate aldolase/2-dehydro-3-deoxy-phosphogluconate aldolase [Algibacillus agarilyticus]
MPLTQQHLQSVDRIAKSRLVAIIRLNNKEDVAGVIACLVAGGITTLEVTANTPGYCEAIAEARAKYPNVLVGAGTITNTERAQQAIDAGAQFIVTPNTEASVITLAHAHNLPVLMGALTPTDIAKAISLKADFIKIFPAGAFGIKYFKDIQGPFSDVPFMPVGGVNINNIAQWFEAGAIGVGVGNDLTQAVNTQQEKNDLIQHVKNYLSKIPNTNQKEA